jgi:transposase
MDTQLNITKTERVDDVPLLLAQMEKMQVANLLDKHFPTHGNWQGLSLGQVVVIWLTYILSEGDHRLNQVQNWVDGLLLTLRICLGIKDLRSLDCSDDRLATVLDVLGQDVAWEHYEAEQNSHLLRTYDLNVLRVRVDTTTAKSYMPVSQDGLFQFGHSKEHRPDLPQLKISQSALDPLGLPLTTTIVSGECADDPLYIPEIRKVQNSLNRSGVLHIGDCKMAALATRCYVAASQDYYLCPLPCVQMPEAALERLLEPVWNKQQMLSPIYRPCEQAGDKPELLAWGFSYGVTRTAEYEGQPCTWQEQCLMVCSLKHAKSQTKALDARLEKATQALMRLNHKGRGKKRLDENQLRDEVERILTQYRVNDLLNVAYQRQSQTVHKRAYRQRPAEIVTLTDITVEVSRNETTYNEAVRQLGWRVYVCNDSNLSLNEAVLAYREEYLIERGFNRYRGKVLGLTPLYLNSTTRIKGLIRLLSIGLRVLCLVEFTVRKALQENNEKLDGIYAGNPKRTTATPTTEMMLKTFRGLSLNVVNSAGVTRYCLTPLNAVQIRILALLGFPSDIYQSLVLQSGQVAVKMSEP